MTNTPNPTPAPDMAVEARVQELMDLAWRYRSAAWQDVDPHKEYLRSALRAALARPQEVAVVTDAKLLQFVAALPWSVDQVRADGKPFKAGERFAAAFTANLDGLTAEWVVSFNTDYGLHETEDDPLMALQAAMKEAKK